MICPRCGAAIEIGVDTRGNAVRFERLRKVYFVQGKDAQGRAVLDVTRADWFVVPHICDSRIDPVSSG